MREPKYRVWDAEEKKFNDAETWLLKQTGELLLSNVDGLYKVNVLFPGRFTTTFFTGLHDCKGKEIYEGDIVRYNDTLWSTSSTCMVEWVCDYSGFLPFCDYDKDCGEFVDLKTVEVIGNQFENIDLLVK